jgi:hypothetical protein
VERGWSGVNELAWHNVTENSTAWQYSAVGHLIKKQNDEKNSYQNRFFESADENVYLSKKRFNKTSRKSDINYIPTENT